MRRDERLRRLAGVVGVAALAGAGMVVGTPGPAGAAAGCVTTDRYHHVSVAPDAISGVVDAAGAQFGATVAVGDFNRDGFTDVAVGAPKDLDGSNAAGAVYVFGGSASGIDTASGTRLTQTDISSGNEAGDKFGAALAAGDFNGDGFDDLAVGIPGEAIKTSTNAGAIGVFMGKADGLTTGTWRSETLNDGVAETGDKFGTSLAAGDLNGDGFDELAIGAPGEAASGTTVHSGSVPVFKGSSTGLTKGWWNTQTDNAGANESGDEFGAAVAIGDVTGDSHADLVVGAPGEAPETDPADSGAIYVIPGSATGKADGLARTQKASGETNEAGDRFGSALAVGDFDGDGKADIAVGIPGEAPGTRPASGAVAVFPGATTAVAKGYLVQEFDTGDAPVAGDKFGSALAAGDVDGDRHADLLVGAPGKSYGAVSHAGSSYLFSGGPRQADSTVSLRSGRRIGEQDVQGVDGSADSFGSAVAMGDVTGDGHADAVVGESGKKVSGTASGAAVQLADLAVPAASTLPIESFAPVSAMQAAPAPGATLGTVEYAYTDNIGRLVHGHQADPDSALSVQFTVISGLEAFTGQPALGEQADGRLQLVAHDIDGPDWTATETAQDPPTWGPFTTLAWPMQSPPATARMADGSDVAFSVDAAGQLWALPQDGVNGAFTSWISLGIGGLTGTPAPVTTSGGIQVFARDTSGDVRTVLYTADRLASGCTSLNGTGLTGTPSVVVYPGSLLRVFARAADGSIVTQEQATDGTWPDAWDTVGTFTATGAPAALLDPSTGRTEVVARAADGSIWNTGETVQGSGEWRSWGQATQVGDVSATDPTVFDLSNSNGTSWAFVFRNSDNVVRVYQARSDFGQTPSTAAVRPAFGAETLPAAPKG